jgi:ubiquinone/menaquinone biosynthesis C-methylase UbiE
VSDPGNFEQVAELYERVRPEYPAAAVAWLLGQLGLGAGSTVLDLGAGTGKLTRALTPRVGRVVAVDPGVNMLAQLRAAVPQAEALRGTAESIPLPDACVDGVVCGQSFHWFRQADALPEILRVLRSGGGLGLIWNVRDPDDEVQQAVSELMAPLVPAGRRPMPATVARLAEATSFGDLTSKAFAFTQELDGDGLAARIASISFVAAADAEQQRRLGGALRSLVADRGGTVTFRYRTEAYATFSAG